MSVYGGDSWAREAQHRKRRVDELMVEGVEDDRSSYKKLSSGKYACLVCPHNPVLDTPLMLSMHGKGSRHEAAESRLKEKELMMREEMSKRLAVSDSSVGSAESKKLRVVSSNPLVKQTWKAASEIVLGKGPSQQHSGHQMFDATVRIERATNATNHSGDSVSCPEVKVDVKLLVEHQVDLRARRERELKFTAAGWKRDGHGKWFRDENVEFDSDEEDPNVSLG